MAEPEYTLEELARITAIRPRTIRHYIQRKLLNGPNSVGRGATYGEYHRKRLEVIRTLRSYQFSIRQIQEYFRHARPDEDIDLAILPIDLSTRGTGGGATPDETLNFIRSRQSLADEDPDDDAPDADAADVDDVEGFAAQAAAPLGLADVAAPYQQDAELSPASPQDVSPPTGPIEQMLQQLSQLTADQRVARRTLGEEWVRFAATPDLEIHVRGEIPPEQLLLFEQIADHIRHILLGGDRHV